MADSLPATEPDTPTYAAVPAPGATEDTGALFPDHVSDIVEVEESAVKGAAPGHAHLNAWLFQRDQEPRKVPIGELAELIQHEDHFVWLQIWGYAPSDLRRIDELLHLGQPAVQRALGPWHRPGLDAYGEQYFVMATLPRIDAAARRIFAGEVDLFVGRNYLVSAHKQPPVLSQRIQTRARLSAGLIHEDSAFLVYIILDELLTYYERLGEHIDDEIEMLEERALIDTSDAYLQELVRLKRYVFALSRLADQHREVLISFLRPDFPFRAPERMCPYFQQLHDRLQHLVTGLASAKDAVNGAFTIYASNVSHRTNAVIRALTVISGLLLPITVILTFFSALAQVSPVYRERGLELMVICMIATVGLSLGLFYRNGWIHFGRRATRSALPDTLALVFKEAEEE